MIYLENINSLNDLFSSRYILATLLISVIFALVQILYLPKFLQILQQNGYKSADYLDWLRQKGNIFRSRLLMCCLLSFLATCLFQAAVYLLKNTVVCCLGFIFFAFFTMLFVVAERKMKKRQKLVVTNRVKRLVACNFVLNTLCNFIFVILINVVFFAIFKDNIFTSLRLSLACLFVFFTPYILAISNVIIKPCEKLLYKRHKKIAEQKLRSLKNVKKIAVTGSYGKTSIKNVLNTILSEKYKVYATPKSYNTPMGIALAVKEIDDSYDVFIVEMGAKHKGDVKELCLMVEPDYGIVGGICGQHLKTFKTLENVKATKSELIQYLKGDIVVLDCDNAVTASLRNIQGKTILSAGFNENFDCYATDLVLTDEGTAFTLCIGGEKRAAYTKLLGKHNVLNIVIASLMSYKLGLSVGEIINGISKIERIEHRLSVTKSNGVTVIDDSYNSNPVGARCAIETVKAFGGRKIILTPGLVELGFKESEENVAFGSAIAECFDKAILVGSNAVAIEQGMLRSGFNYDDIFIAKTFEEAKTHLHEIVKQGDVVLFENDLPDKFS
ncbi:MAG: Mur ligase family protein [Christensenellaceae bacterium]